MKLIFFETFVYPRPLGIYRRIRTRRRCGLRTRTWAGAWMSYIFRGFRY